MKNLQNFNPYSTTRGSWVVKKNCLCAGKTGNPVKVISVEEVDGRFLVAGYHRASEEIRMKMYIAATCQESDLKMTIKNIGTGKFGRLHNRIGSGKGEPCGYADFKDGEITNIEYLGNIIEMLRPDVKAEKATKEVKKAKVAEKEIILNERSITDLFNAGKNTSILKFKEDLLSKLKV